MNIQSLAKALECGIIIVILITNIVPAAHQHSSLCVFSSPSNKVECSTTMNEILNYYESLSGHVTDEEMNSLQGVRVRVSFHDTYRENDTDTTGYYKVIDVPVCADVKNVSCTKLGYYPLYTPMNINESTTHDFVLTSMPIYPEFGSPGESGWYTDGVMISFHFTGPVNHTYYSLNEDPWTKYTGAPITISQDGIYVLHWQCPNKQGNPSVYWVGFKIDRTPPVFQWMDVSSLNYRKTCYLMNASVVDATSGVAKVEFYVDDSYVGEVTRAPYEYLYQGRGRYAQGIVYDNAGNSAMSSPPPFKDLPGFRPDAFPPSASKIQRTGTTLYHGVLLGHVNDTGMHPVKGARVRVSFHDTHRDGYTDASGYYTVTEIPLCPCIKNVSCSANGYYTTYSTVESNESSTHDFVLAAMPVYWTYGGTMGENGWYISTVFFTPVLLNVSHVYYALNEDPWAEYTSPFGVSTDGIYAFHWFWVDHHGISSGVFWLGFKIDRNGPTVTFFKAERLGVKLWKFSTNVSDATSGINRVDIIADNKILRTYTGPPYEVAWVGWGFLLCWKFGITGDWGYLPHCASYDNAGNTIMSPMKR